MQTIYLQNETLFATELAGVKGLYYRGLGFSAETEFLEKHYQEPKFGEISVGKGVFFSDSFEYARSFAKNIILVSTKDMLVKNNTLIDTRKKGYHIPIEERLKKECQNYTCWDVHSKVLEYDTLSIVPGLSCTIYSVRRIITENDLLAKIIL